MINLDRFVKGYSTFDILTNDENTFCKIRKRTSARKEDIVIDHPANGSKGTNYWLTVRGRGMLVSAIQDEVGNYEIWAKRKELQKRGKMILARVNGSYVFSA